MTEHPDSRDESAIDAFTARRIDASFEALVGELVDSVDWAAEATSIAAKFGPVVASPPTEAPARVRRVLGVAAAGPGRELLNIVSSSPDGSLTATIEETDTGRAILSVSGPAEPTVVVRVEWTFRADADTDVGGASESDTDGAPESDAEASTLGATTLVTPLPSNPRGGLARYDLGPLDRVQEIELRPPTTLADRAQLRLEDVDAALASAPFGNAVRAWRELARQPGLAEPISSRITSALGP